LVVGASIAKVLAVAVTMDGADPRGRLSVGPNRRCMRLPTIIPSDPPRTAGVTWSSTAGMAMRSATARTGASHGPARPLGADRNPASTRSKGAFIRLSRACVGGGRAHQASGFSTGPGPRRGATRRTSVNRSVERRLEGPERAEFEALLPPGEMDRQIDVWRRLVGVL
jgi:hypothetical protein